MIARTVLGVWLSFQADTRDRPGILATINTWYKPMPEFARTVLWVLAFVPSRYPKNKERKERGLTLGLGLSVTSPPEIKD
jgi:hypothetical protein